MSPLLESLLRAAHADGLTPVVEDEHTVDLRIVREGRVVAAIRVRYLLTSVVFEAPARIGVDSTGTRVHQPWGSGQMFEVSHMRDLDQWWAAIPAAGRTWTPPPKPWMVPGYWQDQLGYTPGLLPKVAQMRERSARTR